MKVTIEFTLPEEQADLHLAHNGSAYCSALSKLDNYIRDLYKHSDKEYIGIEELRDKFNEIIGDLDINF